MTFYSFLFDLKKKYAFMKGRRLYIKPDEVSKYREMGYTIYRGPRGGLYIDLDEARVRHNERKNEMTQELKSKLQKSASIIENTEFGKWLEEMLNEFINNEDIDYEDFLDGLDRILNEAEKKRENGEITDKEYGAITDIVERLKKKIEDDYFGGVLGIKGYDVVVKGMKVYNKVNERLGVLSKFDEIEFVRYIGTSANGDSYVVKLKEYGTFEVTYDSNGSVKELNVYIGDKKCSFDDMDCIDMWINNTGEKVVKNVINAFKEYYGSEKVSARREIIEIKRPNAEIQKIEVVTPIGFGDRKIRWIAFLIVNAKKIGIAWETIDELIRIFNTGYFGVLIKEMFSVVGVTKI